MTEAQKDLLDATARSVLRMISDIPADKGTEWKRNRYYQPTLYAALTDFTKERFPLLYSGPKHSGSTPLSSARPSDTVSPQD